ncbi:hypothetical protein PC9H_005736 [Pleurotus ostreatus]|uniref:Uncharacterized protein n=1 Tax=Pleurotus ostreatus TaxID=5322 RepID=A0A8H7A033_PLEOS|nr:uncharacterized protein PC9H_005736 [Pleurotus ostreatus]KAF7433771.1 hypothetical protein PC9H_005736 [Pleurotus ostreatus]KAJ8697439.1 hypothetical protein PTI98_004247 [Pleurotus ostreatus]
MDSRSNASSHGERRVMPKQQLALDNRLPPIANTSVQVARPRLPSIHQLPLQSHGRLQNVSNVPHAAVPLHAVLDTAFKRSTERMQAELVQFRSICSRALHKEQQDKETLRQQCMTLMRERDVAREKVRTLMGQKGGDMLLDIDPHSPVSPGAVLPISPTSIQSDAQGNDMMYSYPPPTEATPSDRKRKSGIRSASADPILYAPTHEGDRELPASPLNPQSAHDNAYQKRRRTSESPSPPRFDPVQVTVSHVDLMYMPANGRLVCRACILRNQKEHTKPSSDPSRTLLVPKSFSPKASWDELKRHCVDEHPSECADLASLGPNDVLELRRRLSAPIPPL